jgi:hypothetical protein
MNEDMPAAILDMVLIASIMVAVLCGIVWLCASYNKAQRKRERKVALQEEQRYRDWSAHLHTRPKPTPRSITGLHIVSKQDTNQNNEYVAKPEEWDSLGQHKDKLVQHKDKLAALERNHAIAIKELRNPDAYKTPPTPQQNQYLTTSDIEKIDGYKSEPLPAEYVASLMDLDTKARAKYLHGEFVSEPPTPAPAKSKVRVREPSPAKNAKHTKADDVPE